MKICNCKQFLIVDAITKSAFTGRHYVPISSIIKKLLTNLERKCVCRKKDLNIFELANIIRQLPFNS